MIKSYILVFFRSLTLGVHLKEAVKLLPVDMEGISTMTECATIVPSSSSSKSNNFLVVWAAIDRLGRELGTADSPESE